MENIHKPDDSREMGQPETWSPNDDDKWAWQEKAVLSFDGGGVRGYASLLVLQALMDEIKKEEMNHPDGPHTSSFQLPELSNSPSPAIVDGQAQGLKTPAIDPLNVRTPSWRAGELRSRPKSLEKTKAPSKTAENEGCYLACHYFDYIFGTSTGGLNSIMLGRLRMDVQTCVQMYPEMVRKIFGSPRLTSLKGIIRSKHDPAHLENQVKQLVKQRMPKDVQKHNTDSTKFQRYPSPPDLCRTVVISKEIQENDTVETESPYRFRSYDHHVRRKGDHLTSNYGQANDVAIWEAARATSAALPYLKLIKIGEHKYSDGGLLYNNPTMEAYEEVCSKEGAYPFPFALLVSIGTGMKPGDSKEECPARKRQAVKGLAKFVKSHPFQALRHPKDTISNVVKRHPLVKAGRRALSAITNSELVYREVEKKMRENHRIGDYYRWNVNSDVGILKLDEWKPDKGTEKGTQKTIEESVKIFLDEHRGSLVACAEQLVNLRRARILYDHQRWKLYTQCVEFGCPICQAAFTARPHFEDLGAHVRLQHPQEAPADLDSLIRWAEPYELKPLFPGGPF